MLFRPVIRRPATLVRRGVLLALAGSTLGGCTELTAAVSSEPVEGPALTTAQVTSTERWLVLTRAIIGRREVGSPLAPARNFALVAVAQYNAAVAAGTAEIRNGTPRPSEAAAAAAAAAAVLRTLYPMEDTAITAQVARDAEYFPRFDLTGTYDVAAGATYGARAAAAVLARATTDRTTLVWTGSVPAGPGTWAGAPGVPPVTPRWGEARGWFITSGSQFRPAPPPAYGSAEYRSALAEVRATTDSRTPAQLQLAQFWQFGSGPAGPPGYLSELALGMASTARYTERQTARVLAVESMALMDATIACWDAKYAYWYPRPFESDPGITTPVGRPNFPSYPSAHGCIIGSAGAVLAGMFPAEATAMNARVVEAGTSRIWAGLHYRFDVTAGQTLGQTVGALALTHVPGAREAVPLN